MISPHKSKPKYFVADFDSCVQIVVDVGNVHTTYTMAVATLLAFGRDPAVARSAL